MPGEIQIELKNLRFFAYHGLYAEERKTGNEFEVDIIVAFTPATVIITNLADSVNYVQLYDFIKAEMQNPRYLLETLVMEIAEHIHTHFANVNKVEMTITKLQPPIAGFKGTVGVKYSKGF